MKKCCYVHLITKQSRNNQEGGYFLGVAQKTQPNSQVVQWEHSDTREKKKKGGKKKKDINFLFI